VNFPSMTRRHRATTFCIAVAGALAIAACGTDDGGGATVCTEVTLYCFWFVGVGGFPALKSTHGRFGC
jgi:hypothetical protein